MCCLILKRRSDQLHICKDRPKTYLFKCMHNHLDKVCKKNLSFLTLNKCQQDMSCGVKEIQRHNTYPAHIRSSYLGNNNCLNHNFNMFNLTKPLKNSKFNLQRIYFGMDRQIRLGSNSHPHNNQQIIPGKKTLYHTRPKLSKYLQEFLLLQNQSSNKNPLDKVCYKRDFVHLELSHFKIKTLVYLPDKPTPTHSYFL